ncbi:MAG: complex I subunit 1 family protein [Verrucomicrobiota bacterium]
MNVPRMDHGLFSFIGIFAQFDTTIFVVSSLIKTAVVLGVVLGIVSYTVMAERRVSAALQDRVGPNRVGPFGLLQPICDSAKFIFKEEFTPDHVNKFYFWLAPVLAVCPALITIAVVPFASLQEVQIPFFDILIPSPGVIADIDIGVLFVFALASLSVYGIVLAGWSSNSKYPFLGGIRSSAQMISYEISMGLSIIPLFMVFGTLNLSEIITKQIEHGWTIFPVMSASWTFESFFLLPFLLLSFGLFLVSSFAETNRTPFDLPESETELVGGYHTEYSSMKFALFFLGEYAAMIVASGVMVTLFLGGWSLPLGFIQQAMTHLGIEPIGWFSTLVDWFAGQGHPWWFIPIQVGVFLSKVFVFLFFFIWVRWTVPRFRYDQLMNLGWKIFLPTALANVLLTGIALAILPFAHHLWSSIWHPVWNYLRLMIHH